MQDIDKEPSIGERISDIVDTLKSTGNYETVAVKSISEGSVVIEVQWRNTNYGQTPEVLEKMQITATI